MYVIMLAMHYYTKLLAEMGVTSYFVTKLDASNISNCTMKTVSAYKRYSRNKCRVG